MTFNNMMKYAIVFFISIGAVSTYIQDTYYGYVDDQGIVRDSLFLPISVVSLIIGTACAVLYLVSKFLKKPK